MVYPDRVLGGKGGGAAPASTRTPEMSCKIRSRQVTYYALIKFLVVQFVAESRFANCEFANLFFDFDESQ